jgi:hypothetical protein
MKDIMRILLPLLIFAAFNSSAQKPVNKELTAKPSAQDTLPELKPGHVVFSVPPSISAIEQNSRGINNLEGFRIQIFFGPLEQAKAKRQEFMAKGFVHQAYLEQNVPDFSLRIGDFLTETDAKNELKNFKTSYPNAFIVRGHIEPPNLNFYINAINASGK